MDKISKLILALFVSSFFNDINAMKSSLLVKLKKIAEEKQELKRINKLFQGLHNKKILNPLNFFEVYNNQTGFNELSFSIMKGKKPLYIKNAIEDYKEELYEGLSKERNKVFLFFSYTKMIGESYSNLIALENKGLRKINLYKINKTSKKNIMKLLPCHLDSTKILNLFSQADQEAHCTLSEPSCQFTKNNFLYLSTCNRKNIHNHFLEIWDFENPLELNFLKIKFTLFFKDLKVENSYKQKFILNTLSIVKDDKINTKENPWYVKFTFAMKSMLGEKNRDNDMHCLPSAVFPGQTKNCLNLDEQYIFPVFIMEASENGLQIISKKNPNKENQKDKTFIDIEITGVDDVSKDPKIQTLELIDKFGKKVQ